MDRIELDVNDDTGMAWRKASEQRRKEVSRILEKVIDSIIQKSEEEFKTALMELRKEAAGNGLTEEILNDLLNEKD